MDTNPVRQFAFVNLEQIPEEDIVKLIEAKPTQGNPVVYQAGLLDAGMFVLVSEERNIREDDFANYSAQMKNIVEWAAQKEALYLMLSEHCQEADLTTAQGVTP